MRKNDIKINIRQDFADFRETVKRFSGLACGGRFSAAR
jgi:hypothetical protein